MKFRVPKCVNICTFSYTEVLRNIFKLITGHTLENSDLKEMTCTHIHQYKNVIFGFSVSKTSGHAYIKIPIIYFA